MPLPFFFQCYADHRHLHSFPTRRSSDLLKALRDALSRDKAAGVRPICIVGNAGTVNTGATDDLRALARIAREDKDRKSTRLNSSHTVISYAVFCLKKKKWRRGMVA